MPNRRNFLRLGAGAAAVAAVGAPAASARGRRGTDWERLRRTLSGDLVLAGDPRYETARQLNIKQFDSVHPQAVAYCATPQDVRTVLGFAQDNGLPAVPRSGGHSFGGYSTSPGIVLDVSRLNQVQIAGPTVVVGPGTQQVDALRALSPSGLALAGGTCPNVCLGGFVQGGGIGYLTRAYGLACDRMVSASVVLADGRTVRAAADEHPDLFWALRGNGGGNFGVVTGYELRPASVGRMVNYSLTFQWDAAGAVIKAWQQWMLTAPRELSGTVNVLDGDPVAAVPQVMVNGAFVGTQADADRLADELVAQVGVPPLNRAVAEKSYYSAMMEWYGCADLSVDQCHRVGYSPEAQLARMNFYHTRNRMYADAVPEQDVDRMLTAFTSEARSGQFRLIFFEALGGAAGEPARTDTAYVHRTAKFVAGFGCALDSPDYTEEDRAACEHWLTATFATLEPHALRESYQNFMDPALPDWRSSYYAENYARLVEVRHRYDPHHFFRFARAIG